MLRSLTNNRFDVILFSLVLALSFGGIGGAFQVDRILAIMFLPILFSNINKVGCGYARSFLRVFFLFYLYMLLSVLWTPDKSEAFKELIYYPIHFILFLELIVFSRFSNNPLDIISKGWLFSVLVCLMVASWELTTGNHLAIAIDQGDTISTGAELIQHMTASVTFGNYNGFNTFLCFSFPWVFYIVINSQRYTYVVRLLAAAALVLSFIVILINASRGGVLSIFLMLVVFLFLEKKRIYKVIFIFFSAFLIYFIIRYGEGITAVFEARAMGEGGYTDEGRMLIWKHALQAFADSFGFGVGVGGLQAAMDNYANGGVNITHNLFLEILVQFGVIIAFIILRFFIKLYRIARKVEENRKMVILMSILTMPIYGIVDSSYLLSPPTCVLIATIYIFTYYEHIRCNYAVLREAT